MGKDLNITKEDAAILQRLIEVITAGKLAFSSALSVLYVQLRVGGGIFRGRKMSRQVEEQTLHETTAYIAALLTILLENWPNRPSNFRSIITILETSLFDVQRVNLRPLYEIYLGRYREQRPADSKLFAPEIAVHTEFVIRISDIWSFHQLKIPPNKFAAFSKVMPEITHGAEAWLRKTLDTPEEAIISHKKAIETKPHFADAYYNLGLAYVEKGLHDRAFESFKKTVEIKPDYAWAHFALGFAYKERGLHDKEIASYKKAIEIRPNMWVAHWSLGLAYVKKEVYDKALKSFKKTVKLKPDHAEAHWSLGLAYVEKGLYDKALESFKKTVKLKPDYAEAHYNLGEAYLKKGLYYKAIVSFKKVIEIKPDHAEVHCNLGLAYLAYGEKGLYDNATVCFKKAIELKPDYAWAYAYLGALYFDIGLKYEAADHYYKAGLLFLEQGNRKSALRTYEDMRKYMPNHELTSKLHRKLYPE